MSILHFENGKNVTVQHVNTAINIENIKHNWTAATDWSKTYTVPPNKKWSIYRISGYRDNPGDIIVYLRDPDGNYTMLDSDLASSRGLKVVIDQPFTITAGWELTVYFYTGIIGMMYCNVLHTEEAE